MNHFYTFNYNNLFYENKAKLYYYSLDRHVQLDSGKPFELVNSNEQQLISNLNN